MKIKTSELTGPALDWAVAETNGMPIYRRGKTMTRMDMDGQHYWQPSTDWAQGGPIIEREGIELFRNSEKNYWFTSKTRGGAYGTGPTPLIAAMRCYVASKLGDEIELPEGLK